MKVKLLLVSAILMGMTLTSCDETTEMIGGSLIDNVDKLVVDADTFNVSSKSILAKDIIGKYEGQRVGFDSHSEFYDSISRPIQLRNSGRGQNYKS